MLHQLVFVTDVWFIGDSYVRRLQVRARFRGIDKNLKAQNIAGIKWLGVGGMRWPDLKPKIRCWPKITTAPRAIVIHLGGNDLGSTVGCCLEHAVRQDLAFIQVMFPNCKIIFSQVIPRQVWSGVRHSIQKDRN